MDSNRDLVELYNNEELPPLFVTVINGLFLCTKYLLYTCKEDVNEICCGETALTMAIRAKQGKIIETLLEHPDITPSRLPNQRWTLWIYAIECYPEYIPNLLRKSTLDINETDVVGYT